MKEEKRGGARAGSGRKAIENKRVQMVVTIKDTTKSTLKQEAKERHTRPGRMIDEWVEREFKKEG